MKTTEWFCFETVNTQKKLNKLLLFLLLSRKSKLQIRVNRKTKNKNTFLKSPFHFKVAKKHLEVPLILFTLTLPVKTTSSICTGFVGTTVWEKTSETVRIRL